MTQATEEVVTVQNLPVAEIQTSGDNPRKITDDDPYIGELAASIHETGLINPITVRKHKNLAKGKKDFYEVVAGECRFRAHRKLGRKTIPAIIKELNNEQARAVIITENLQRKDLHPVEEARGIKGFMTMDWSVEEIAAHLGKSVSWVYRRAQLTHLTELWWKAIDDTKHKMVHLWSAQLLEEIARLAPASQDKIYKQLDNLGRLVRICTLDDVKYKVKDVTQELRSAPWNLDEDLSKTLTACTTCTRRTGAQPDLFDEGEVGKGDVCLDSACYAKKRNVYRKRAIAEAQEKYGKKVLIFTRDRAPKGCWSTYSPNKVKKGTKGAVRAFDLDQGKPCFIHKPTYGYNPAKGEAGEVQSGYNDADYQYRNKCAAVDRDRAKKLAPVLKKHVRDLLPQLSVHMRMVLFMRLECQVMNEPKGLVTKGNVNLEKFGTMLDAALVESVTEWNLKADEEEWLPLLHGNTVKEYKAEVEKVHAELPYPPDPSKKAEEKAAKKQPPKAAKKSSTKKKPAKKKSEDE